jgi:hypothetical protein
LYSSRLRGPTLPAAPPSALSPAATAAAAAVVASTGECDATASLQALWLNALSSPAAGAELAAADANTLLLLAKALTKLQQPMPLTWSRSFATAITGSLAVASDLQLLNIFKALGPVLGGAAAHAGLTKGLLQQLQLDMLVNYSPAQLTSLVKALENSACSPSRSWMVMLVQDVLSPRLEEFRGWQLVSLLASLARMRYVPDTPFLRAATKATGDKLGFITEPRVLQELLSALVTLSHRPGRAWVRRFSKRSLDVGFKGLTGGQLVRFCWCMAAIGRHPGAPWMTSLLEEVGEKLHELHPVG